MANKKRKPPAKKQAPRPKTPPKPAPAGGEVKLTREERWDAARKAKRRRTLLRRVVVTVVVVALVGGIAAWQLGKRRAETRAIAAMEAGTCEFDRKTDEGAVNEHAPNPTFTLEPPSGGVHSPNVAGAGVFIDQPAPPDAQIVHALEHGDIALWYRPDLPEADVQGLRDLAEEFPTDVLVVRRPQLPVQLAATAWHKRLLCDGFEQPALTRFIERWHDKGPEGQTD